MSYKNRLRCSLIAALVTATVFATTAQAQKKIPVLPMKEQTKYRSAANDILKGKAPFSKKAIEGYYLRSLLAPLTQESVDKNAVSSARSTIVLNLSNAYAKNPQVYPKLRSLIYAYTSELIKPGYSHVARYNAMLILGTLNEKEGTKQSLPKGHAGSLKKLYLGMKQNESDAVKVAALVGLKRHAGLDRAGSKMSGGAKLAVIKAAVALIESECPATRSKSGHEWMQRQAMDLLGTFGWAGKDGAIAKQMDSIIQDEKASIAKRCSAMEALAQLRMSNPPAGMDVDASAKGIGTTTIEVCKIIGDRLAKRFDEREKAGGVAGGAGAYGGGGGGGGYPGGGGAGGYPGGGGGGSDGGYGAAYGGGGGGDGGYGGAYGGGLDDDEEEKPKEDDLLTEARRDTKFRITSVQRANAVLKRLSPQDPTISDLDKLVKALMTDIDAEDLPAKTFKDTLDTMVADIEDLFGIESVEPEEKQAQPAKVARRR